MPHLQALHYSGLDELLAARRGDMELSFQYAGGQRIRKWVEKGNGIIEERIYIGGTEYFRKFKPSAPATPTEATQTEHLPGGGLVDTKTHKDGSPKPKPKPLFRHSLGNHLGSAQLEVDEDGKVISYEEFHPYGTSSLRAVRADVEVADFNRYRFTGMERDDETGLQQHGARYYVPWLGRWLSADPIGLGDGLNRFAYCRGSPVCSVDRGGTRTEPPEGTSYGAGAGVLVNTGRGMGGRGPTLLDSDPDDDEAIRYAGTSDPAPFFTTDDPGGKGANRRRPRLAGIPAGAQRKADAGVLPQGTYTFESSHGPNAHLWIRDHRDGNREIVAWHDYPTGPDYIAEYHGTDATRTAALVRAFSQMNRITNRYVAAGYHPGFAHAMAVRAGVAELKAVVEAANNILGGVGGLGGVRSHNFEVSTPQQGSRVRGKATSRVIDVDAGDVRFSQSNVKESLPSVVESMKIGGFNGSPIDVVRMPDGTLTSIDNTRVAAGSLTSTRLKANVHHFEEPFPLSRGPEYFRMKGSKDLPTTYGEAILGRISRQHKGWVRKYPMGSSYTGVHKKMRPISGN